MMFARAKPLVVKPVTPRPDNLLHWVCRCDTDTALCGFDVTDEPFRTGPDEDRCVVCVDLDAFACPRCGR